MSERGNKGEEALHYPALVRCNEGLLRTEFFGITISMFYSFSFALTAVWDSMLIEWIPFMIEDSYRKHTHKRFFLLPAMLSKSLPIVWTREMKKKCQKARGILSRLGKTLINIYYTYITWRIGWRLVVMRASFYRSWLGSTVICLRKELCYL